MSTNQDSFISKKSSRMPRNIQNLKGDGDLWVERIGYDKKGVKRSFFQSVRTDLCKWDEPPTGATKIVLASELEKYPFLKEKFHSEAPPASKHT